MTKLFFLIVCLCFLNATRAQPTDLSILKSINQGYMPGWDKAMKDLSFTAYPVAPLSVGFILGQGYYKKDKSLIRNGYKSVITLALAMTISTGTKYLVQRARPVNSYPNDIIARDHSGTYSFPSGHTTASFATATALTLTYKKWYVAVPAYTYAGFVGYSRMRLGVHYPTDVLGGIIAGIGSGLLTWQLDKLLNKK
jgi:membrane-associated phospholipid phosphatase